MGEKSEHTKDTQWRKDNHNQRSAGQNIPGGDWRKGQNIQNKQTNTTIGQQVRTYEMYTVEKRQTNATRSQQIRPCKIHMVNFVSSDQIKMIIFRNIVKTLSVSSTVYI